MNFLHNLLQKYDAFVFDVDDTLLYTFRNGYRKLQIVALALGYSGLDFKEYANYYGVLSFEECLARWFSEIEVPLAIRTYKEASAQIPYEAICDFSELQSLLSRQGKQTAILTNGHNDMKLRQKLEICGVNEDLLAGLWGAENLPAPKPSALAMLPAKECFPESSILYVGDAVGDKDMAMAAGVGFLQVYTGKDGPLPGVSGITSLQVLIDCLREW